MLFFILAKGYFSHMWQTCGSPPPVTLLYLQKPHINRYQELGHEYFKAKHRKLLKKELNIPPESLRDQNHMAQTACGVNSIMVGLLILTSCKIRGAQVLEQRLSDV